MTMAASIASKRTLRLLHFCSDCALFPACTQRVLSAAGDPSSSVEQWAARLLTIIQSHPKYDIKRLKDVPYNTHSPGFIPLKILIKFWATHRHDPGCVLLGSLPPIGYLSVFRQLSEANPNGLAQGCSRRAVVTNANCSQWGAQDGSYPLIVAIAGDIHGLCLYCFVF